jgi:hypothetical protein
LGRVDHSPAEGAITSVDFAFHILRLSILGEGPPGEVTKRDASAKEETIADNMVNVFPKPISSAKIPPRGRTGTCAFSQVTILCSYLPISESGGALRRKSKNLHCERFKYLYQCDWSPSTCLHKEKWSSTVGFSFCEMKDSPSF